MVGRDDAMSVVHRTNMYFHSLFLKSTDFIAGQRTRLTLETPLMEQCTSILLQYIALEYLSRSKAEDNQRLGLIYHTPRADVVAGASPLASRLMFTAILIDSSGAVVESTTIDTKEDAVAPRMILGIGAAADPIQSCNDTHAENKLLGLR